MQRCQQAARPWMCCQPYLVAGTSVACGIETRRHFRHGVAQSVKFSICSSTVVVFGPLHLGAARSELAWKPAKSYNGVHVPAPPLPLSCVTRLKVVAWQLPTRPQVACFELATWIAALAPAIVGAEVRCASARCCRECVPGEASSPSSCTAQHGAQARGQCVGHELQTAR